MNKYLNKIRNKALKTGLVIVGTTAAFAGSAMAQTPNEGVTAIVSAINGLKPDMGTVVLAGIGLALIGIGAVVALSLGKKIMGK